MQIKELIQRFNQPWQNKPVYDYPGLVSNRPAAVLIAVHFYQGELHVIFTKRAEHLTHHAGEISFPGGKCEVNDDSIFYTAMREAQEEIGLPISNIEVIGQLPNFKTISGFEVTPILASVKQSIDITKELIIDQNEVSEVFQVPLSYLMDERNLLKQYVKRKDVESPVYFIPYIPID